MQSCHGATPRDRQKNVGYHNFAEQCSQDCSLINCPRYLIPPFQAKKPPLQTEQITLGIHFVNCVRPSSDLLGGFLYPARRLQYPRLTKTPSLTLRSAPLLSWPYCYFQPPKWNIRFPFLDSGGLRKSQTAAATTNGASCPIALLRLTVLSSLRTLSMRTLSTQTKIHSAMSTCMQFMTIFKSNA